MDIHASVLENLQQWKYRWPQVAAGTGISLRTIEKIARQESKDPGVQKIQQLHNFFQSQDTPAQ